MKWKDSDHISGEDQPGEEDLLEDEGYTPWENKKHRGNHMASRGNRVMIYAAIGVAVIVLLGGVLVPQIKVAAQKAEVEALEAKVTMLQKRMEKYESIDEKVTRIWEQAKAFEKFKERFDRSESSTLLRMDHLAMSLDELQKQTDAAIKKIDRKASIPTASKKSKPVSVKNKTVYHTVKPGETLYSISKAYDLDVKVLMKKNNLSPASVLQVGQKLAIN